MEFDVLIEIKGLSCYLDLEHFHQEEYFHLVLEEATALLSLKKEGFWHGNFGECD